LGKTDAAEHELASTLELSADPLPINHGGTVRWQGSPRELEDLEFHAKDHTDKAAFADEAGPAAAEALERPRWCDL
jgi:hypothetical protein